MTRAQRRQAIKGPAAVSGAAMTPRLVRRLLNDVGDNPDQLPILQHALMRAWDNWRNSSDSQPDLLHYTDIGGMDAALSKHADEVYNGLPDDRSREIVEKLFKAVTVMGADNRGVRRPTRLDELCAITSVDRDDLIEVIEAFRGPGRSFLAPPAGTPLAYDSVVDISHESLMRIWDRLKKWVEEEAESAHWFHRRIEGSGVRRPNRVAP